VAGQRDRDHGTRPTEDLLVDRDSIGPPIRNPEAAWRLSDVASWQIPCTLLAIGEGHPSHGIAREAPTGRVGTNGILARAESGLERLNTKVDRHGTPALDNQLSYLVSDGGVAFTPPFRQPINLRGKAGEAFLVQQVVVESLCLIHDPDLGRNLVSA